jgi:hypothetical protein
MKSRFETMLYVQGLDADALDNTPEARAMREVEVEILSRAREAIEAAQAELAEEEAQQALEVVEQETPKEAETAKKTKSSKKTIKKSDK